MTDPKHDLTMDAEYEFLPCDESCIPDIPEGYTLIADNRGCCLVPDVSEEEYEAVFGPPLTLEEYEAIQAEIAEPEWTDDDIALVETLSAAEPVQLEIDLEQFGGLDFYSIFAN